jgi:hypothetical protein
MRWRTVQLGNRLCDQDQLILDLFGNRPVKYLGSDLTFAKNLNIDSNSTTVVAVFNSPGWLTDLLDFIQSSINNSNEFYIGINRYCLIGNNTTHSFINGDGKTLIDFIGNRISKLGYTITKSGHMDNDNGKHFNFVQPLTWIYGTNNCN